MQRSITIPFNSGSVTFVASYESPNSDKDFGYLLDDALKRGGTVTFEQVIPKLNHLARRYDEQEQAGVSNITAGGSTEIDGVTATVTVMADINRTDVDAELVRGLLKSTIVRDTLGYLVEMASTPDIPESIGDLLSGLLGDTLGSRLIDLSGLAGARR